MKKHDHSGWLEDMPALSSSEPSDSCSGHLLLSHNQTDSMLHVRRSATAAACWLAALAFWHWQMLPPSPLHRHTSWNMWVVRSEIGMSRWKLGRVPDLCA